MRKILFLSRLTLICNIAFALFVFFQWLEIRKPADVSGDRVVNFPFFKDLIITLGFTAIFINLIMNIIYFILLLSRKTNLLPKWLIVFNFIFLLLQIYYFFLFK
jgi:energy-converting hydrogenase Eha subunit A